MDSLPSKKNSNLSWKAENTFQFCLSWLCNDREWSETEESFAFWLLKDFEKILSYNTSPPSSSVTKGPVEVSSGYWTITKSVARTNLTSITSCSCVLDRKLQIERREVELRTCVTCTAIMNVTGLSLSYSPTQRSQRAWRWWWLWTPTPTPDWADCGPPCRQ